MAPNPLKTLRSLRPAPPRSDRVEIELHRLRQRPGLAGERVAGLELPGLERVVDVHRDFALQNPAAAGAAHAAPARMRNLEPLGVRGVDDEPPRRDLDPMR